MHGAQFALIGAADRIPDSCVSQLFPTLSGRLPVHLDGRTNRPNECVASEHDSTAYFYCVIIATGRQTLSIYDG